MAKQLKESYHVGAGEKTSYGLYFMGQNIIACLVMVNVQIMFADVGITVAAVAIILLITKVWDAVNDPLFGILIDKIRFKKGRFLPWIRISLPLISITSTLLFAIPSTVSLKMKVIWAVVAYIAWDMSYTLSDVPIFVLPTSMTNNIKERTGILSIGRYLAMFGFMGATVAIPVMQSRLGWFMTGLILVITATILMLPICFKAKERCIVRPESEVTLRQMFKYVVGNKFLLVFYISLFISFSTNFAMTLGIFFARYNLGNQDLSAVIQLASLLPTLLVGAFVAVITKKVDKYHLFIAASIGSAAVGILRYFIGYGNFTLFMAFAVIHGILTSLTGILIYMFTPDCLEYGTYRTGERAEGVAASVQTFFTKLSNSIVGPFAFIFLALFGFVSGETTVQTETAQNGIFLCMTVFPAIGVAVSVLVLRWYKLRDKDVQVMSEYNMGKITKQEAESILKEKYGPAADIGKLVITDTL